MSAASPEGGSVIGALGPGLRAWGPVFAWMAAIFALSTDLGAATNTSRFLEPLLRWVAPEMSAETFALVHAIVRKAAHVVEYAILAVLVRRALRSGAGGSALAWGSRPELLAWIWAIAFAASDELHQGLVESRGASAGDVLVDAVGAALGLAIATAATRASAARRSAS